MVACNGSGGWLAALAPAMVCILFMNSEMVMVTGSSSQAEHEATTSKIGEEQLFYCNQRGISTEEAVALIVNGYCKEVLNKLPMEFA